MTLGRILALLLGLWAGSALAQDPRITVATEQQQMIVGQPFVLRLEVLVPTFMPRAPAFPSFEMPGLIVRLPERSTEPFSERIEGATWAGVRRTYRIFPMRAGVTDIPAQSVSIVYKDPESNEDVPLTVDLPPVPIVATVPTGARKLDPLILAEGLSIKQSWELEDGDLSVGDAVVRSLEVVVSGTSALFVPPLLDGTPPGAAANRQVDEDAPPVAAFVPYPEDARVAESFDGGRMSGTRSERVSYIAQSGGVVDFPEIVLKWYNLGTEEIEEIVLPGRTVTVSRPPQADASIDWGLARRVAVFFAIGLAMIWVGRRWLWPRLYPGFVAIRNWYEGTKLCAHRDAKKAARARDLNALWLALDRRAERGHPTGIALTRALEELTRAIYRDNAEQSEVLLHWQSVSRALTRDRPRILRHGGSKAVLPPLNPFLKSGR